MSDYNRFNTPSAYQDAVRLLENAYKIADLFEQQEAQRKINESRRVNAEAIREEAHLRQEQQIIDVNNMLAQGVFKGAKGDKGDIGPAGPQGIQGVPGMTSSEAALINLQEQARVAAELSRASTFSDWEDDMAAWAQAEADRVLAEIAREAVVQGYADDLALKAPLASPTFTGTVVLPAATSIGAVSATELGYLSGVTSAIQTQLGTKAPLASPNFTGTPTLSGIGRMIANSASAGTAVNYIWSGTQAQYDAIGTKDANTLYFIV